MTSRNRDAGDLIKKFPVVRTIGKEPSMYAIRIVYPRTPGSTFNLRHYLDVHTPLGLGLLKSTFGISPVRVEVDSEPMPRGSESPSYHCACHLYFEKLSDVEAFKALTSREDTRKQLADDFQYYTSNNPIVSVSKVLTLDPVEYFPSK